MSRVFSGRGRLLIHYQEWSGCVAESSRPGEFPLLAFDPAPGHLLPARPLVILISHGHPEHVAGAAAHLSLARRPGVTVIASRSVCAYLKKLSRNSADNFLAVKPGETFEACGLRFEIFTWKHMPLLPPGWMRKAVYLARLASDPHLLATIALQGLAGPKHGPMLGFRINEKNGAHLVYIGEGMHRETSRAALRACLGNCPVDVLLSAVEPEDCDVLPGLVSGLPIRNLLVFEAHRNWRDQFGLPQADLKAFAGNVRTLGEGGFWPLKPGQTVELSLPSPS